MENTDDPVDPQPVTKEDPRKHYLTCSFNEQDREMLDFVCTRTGLSQTELLRRCLWIVAAGIPLSRTLHVKDPNPVATEWLLTNKI